MADDDHSDDFTVDRSNNRPARTDNRGMLHMLHDEIGKALGIGKGDGTKYVPNSKPGVMDAVDEAVKGAPPPGSESN